MVKRPRRALLAALASAAAAPSIGCEVVLGIEQARVDPSLSPSQAGTGGGSSGSNGAGGSDPGGSPNGGGKGGTDPSGGSGNDGAGGSSAAGGSGGAPQKTLCEEYCEEVIGNCDPEGGAEPPLKQFADSAQCLAACALFPPGEDGDRGVNTIECRLTRAQSAQSEPSIECPRAGPAPGTNGCGTPCEAYCSLMMGACTEETTFGEAGWYFEDYETCMTTCAQVPDTQPYVFSPDTNLITGNHLACRIYHVVVATEGDFEHCLHAMGDFPCVD